MTFKQFTDLLVENKLIEDYQAYVGEIYVTNLVEEYYDDTVLHYNENILELEPFDNIVEFIFPSFPFLQYKSLYKKVVKNREEKQTNYNSRDSKVFRVTFCDLKELYTELVNLGMLLYSTDYPQQKG